MGILATNRQATIVRPIEPTDVHKLLRLINTAWRVHLRFPPAELGAKVKTVPGFLAEDGVGLRGFMVVEPQPPAVALIIAAGLRDTWSVKPYLDLFLPKIERGIVEHNLLALGYVGNAPWLVNELRYRGFEIQDWIVAFERMGTERPVAPTLAPALIRTAHHNDLPALLALDKLAFGHIWHKSAGTFSQALTRAGSFFVALVDNQIIAYEWCERHGQHAHLTRLAVHPDYQGRGIGAQLLYQAITDALAHGANVITLNTQEHNYRSQALYERFGFVDTKKRMPVLWKDLR